MKINYIGIVAGIIAFVSIALPWWTITYLARSTSLVDFSEVEVRGDISVFTYKARETDEAVGWGYKYSEDIPMELWYGWVALALIVIAGIAGIVGSLIIGKKGKMILLVAGILALFSIIIFAVGLQGELSEGRLLSGFLTHPKLGLFCRDTFVETILRVTHSLDYTCYLTFGFWLALAAGLIALIASYKHPMAPPEAPPPGASLP